jgi:hypothetical protein
MTRPTRRSGRSTRSSMTGYLELATLALALLLGLVLAERFL